MTEKTQPTDAQGLRESFTAADMATASAQGFRDGVASVAARAPADSVPVARFDDPKVQAVYAILCSDVQPPEGEHWEGFAARRIVDALSADSVTAPAGGGAVVEWHAPGLGEVHNESHGQLIFCTDGDDVADDTLARRVCAALNATPATPAATPSAASLAWNALRDLTDPLGEAGVKIMGHVRIHAQRQYEAGKEEADRAARAPADSLQEDAARWHWLAEYLVGTRTDLDDEIVASETVNDLRKLVDAARKQGGRV